MGTVYLSSLRQLQPALNKLAAITEVRIVKSLRETAGFGRTAVVRTTKRTRDPHTIRASGSYENNWIKADIKDGAVVANAIFYSLFVERGRAPGRAPPLAPIIEWIKQKRIAPKIQGPKQQFKGKGSVAKRREAKITAARVEADALWAMARAIQRKIARKGTKGRFVLKRTMPMITKRAVRGVRRVLRDLAKDPPVT